MGKPAFEPISECSICGLDFPESELQKHYRTGRLVDDLCADEPGATDYLEKLRRPVEHQKRARQRVPRSEDGYIATDWAAIAITGAAGMGAVGSVVGDNKAGIITITAGASTLPGLILLFTLSYGTALVAVPSRVVLVPWDPNAEFVNIRSDVVPPDEFGFSGWLVDVALQPYVTYQWRYEVKV